MKIALRDVRRSFDGRPVLAGVSLDIEAAEVVALVGPSGGGKTTLLRCLNGLESIDAGEIHVGDARIVPGGDARNHATLHAIRQRVGFVFQQWHLFSHRTALENVAEAPIYVQREPRARALARAEHLLEKVGLAHRIHAMPRALSGGEQQRVAIARALAMSPSALLLDEPTSALDPQRVDDVVALLRALANEGITLITVTHDMRFVRALADRVVVLHGGSIIEQGSPRELLSNPIDARTRSFLGLDEPT